MKISTNPCAPGALTSWTLRPSNKAEEQCMHFLINALSEAYADKSYCPAFTADELIPFVIANEAHPLKGVKTNMPAFEKLKDKFKKDIISSFISEGLTLGESKEIIGDLRGSLFAISFESMRESEKENLSEYTDQLRLRTLA